MSERDSESGHKMGKWCGYDLLPDGSIRIAPIYIHDFENISDQRVAVKNVLDSITLQCAAMERSTAKQARELWSRVAEDCGINLADGWQLENGVLRKPPKESKP